MDAVAPVQLDRAPLTHRVRRRRGGRARHRPPRPCVTAEPRRDLQRAHVVPGHEPDGGERSVERLEEERDGRLRHFCRERCPREARREALQDLGTAPCVVVDRTEPRTLEGDPELLRHADESGPHLGDEPAPRPRSGDERADDLPARPEQRDGEQRLERDGLRQLAESRTELVVRELDRQARRDRLTRDLVRRAEILRLALGCEPLHLVIAPDVEGHEVDAGCGEVGDRRRRQLRRRGVGAEMPRGPPEELRALARRALGVVHAAQPPLRRDPGPGEHRKHQGENRPADEDRQRGGAGDRLAARRDEPPAAAESDRAGRAGRRGVVRGEDRGVADRDPGADVRRQPGQNRGDHVPAEPGRHVPDRRTVLLVRRVDRPERLKAAPSEHERDVAGEHGLPRGPGAVEEAPAHGGARQVEPQEAGQLPVLRPDSDHRDIRAPRARGSQRAATRDLRDPPAGHPLEVGPPVCRDDLRERKPGGRTDRADGTRVGLEARAVDVAVRVDQACGCPQAREDTADAVLEGLVDRLGGPVVLDARTVVGTGPQQPCHRDGRDCDEYDERAADDGRRGDARLHPWRDTTPALTGAARIQRPAGKA